mmetsp:Transcript_10823/g.24463  ORF Transcript_10823/g.24463 Transcript_10823/m.24463 type:complete len:292 (-) Transcript_10823:305-1180(-)
MSLPAMPRMLNRNPAAASARVPSPYTAMAVTLSSAPALSKSSTSGSSQSDVGGVFFATRVRASSSALLRCSRAVRLCASDSFKFVATMRSPLGSAGMGMASPGACVSRNFSNSSTRLVYSGVPGFPVSLKFPHRSPNHASSSQHLDAAPPPFVAFAFFKHADATVFASSCAVGPLSSVTAFLTAFSTSVTRLAGRSSLTLSKKRSASRCFTHPPFCFFCCFSMSRRACRDIPAVLFPESPPVSGAGAIAPPEALFPRRLLISLIFKETSRRGSPAFSRLIVYCSSASFNKP